MKISMTPIKVTRGILANPEVLSRVIENALTGAALGVKADYGVTTQTWKHRVKFAIQSKLGERIISTNDEIYGYVDRGTRAHIIRAKRGVLSFKSGYRAKTSPNAIASQSGGAFGESRFAKQVRHPGTAARNFSRVIAAKWQKELPKIMQRAIDAEL